MILPITEYKDQKSVVYSYIIDKFWLKSDRGRKIGKIKLYFIIYDSKIIISEKNM